MTDRPTDAIERAAREIAPLAWAALGTGDTMAQRNRRTASLRHAKTALASLRPGDRITLADGTECWIAPVEPTWAMQIKGRDRILNDDQDLDLSTDDAWACYRAMRDACKEDAG